MSKAIPSNRCIDASTPEELEAAVGEWLMNTIQKLELERTQRQSRTARQKEASATRRRGFGVRRQCSAGVPIRTVRTLLTIAGADCFVFTTISRTVKRRLSRLLRKTFLAV